MTIFKSGGGVSPGEMESREKAMEMGRVMESENRSMNIRISFKRSIVCRLVLKHNEICLPCQAEWKCDFDNQDNF